MRVIQLKGNNGNESLISNTTPPLLSFATSCWKLEMSTVRLWTHNEIKNVVGCSKDSMRVIQLNGNNGNESLISNTTPQLLTLATFQWLSPLRIRDELHQ